jgi:hypothetical protein
MPNRPSNKLTYLLAPIIIAPLLALAAYYVYTFGVKLSNAAKVDVGVWQPADGPWGGYVSALSQVDGVLLAASEQGGVFTCKDGVTWDGVGLQGEDVQAVCGTASGVVLAGLKAKGVWMKSPSDSSWTQTSVTEANVYSIIATPTAVLAASGYGIYRTTDDGKTWKHVTPPETVWMLAVSGGVCYAATETNGVYASSDDGLSWRKTSPLNMKPLVVQAGEAGTLYASSFHKGLFKTTNGGHVWLDVSSGLEEKLQISKFEKTILQVTSLVALPSGLLVTGTPDGLYEKHPADKSWKPSALDGQSITAMMLKGKSLFIATAGGLYESDVASGRLEKPNKLELAVHHLSTFGMLGDTLVTASASGGIYKLIDGNWLLTGFDTVSVSAFASKGSVALAATSEGVFRTSDGGQTWTRAGLATVETYSLLIASNGAVLAGTNNGIYDTRLETLDAKSWHVSQRGLDNFDVYALAASDTTIFAATGFGVSRRNISDTLWTSTTLNNVEVRALLLDKTGTLYAATKFNKLTANGGLYRSTDGGTSWMNCGLNTQTVLALAAGDAGDLYAATDDGKIYISSNGTAWHPLAAPALAGVEIHALKVHARTLFAATAGKSVWKASLKPQD